MKQTLLPGDFQLSQHHHHDTKIDIPEIAHEFDASGTRRIGFLHTPDTWFNYYFFLLLQI